MIVIPETRYILALRNQHLTWKTVASELIDNSFDAGATEPRARHTLPAGELEGR